MEVNATAVRVLLERLVDEFGELEMLVWKEPGPEREDLRRRVSDAMLLACSACDVLAPPSRVVAQELV